MVIRYRNNSFLALFLSGLVIGQLLAEVRSQVINFAAEGPIEAIDGEQAADPAEDGDVEVIRLDRGALDNVDKKKLLIGGGLLALGALAAGGAVAAHKQYQKHKNATATAKAKAEEEAMATTTAVPEEHHQRHHGRQYVIIPVRRTYPYHRSDD